MSENDRVHLEAIEEIVGRKVKEIVGKEMEEASQKMNKKSFKNMLVITGAVTGIFLGVSVPMGNSLIALIAKKPVGEKEVYDNFIDKSSFHQLQKAEHISDVEAIQNPQNAANIYARHNNDEAEKLDLRYRGSEK